MANHVRQQIRSALKTRLTGLVTTGSNVFTARVYPMEDAELPGILIKNGGEQSEIVTLGSPAAELQRAAEMIIQAIAKSNTDLDDLMDTICKEVEIAIASDDTFGGLVSGGMMLTNTDEPEFSGEGEHPVAQVTMHWQANYYSLKNTPDVAR